MNNRLYKYLLILGDNSLILAQRLSGLCGHGPSLETDIALTNISLDLFGEVRGYFQYAATLNGETQTEDTIAFLRYERDYCNAWLVEQPNTDFAYVIGRQFLYDAYHVPLLEQLAGSQDRQLAAIASKSVKEARYHLRFSSEWVRRLAGGTDESLARMQVAMDHLFPFGYEFFKESDVEAEMKEARIGADLEYVRTLWEQEIEKMYQETPLKKTESPIRQTGGKQGIHSENMGYILSEMQFMQRAYPNMQW